MWVKLDTVTKNRARGTIKGHKGAPDKLAVVEEDVHRYGTWDRSRDRSSSPLRRSQRGGGWWDPVDGCRRRANVCASVEKSARSIDWETNRGEEGYRGSRHEDGYSHRGEGRPAQTRKGPRVGGSARPRGGELVEQSTIGVLVAQATGWSSRAVGTSSDAIGMGRRQPWGRQRRREGHRLAVVREGGVHGRAGRGTI